MRTFLTICRMDIRLIFSSRIAVGWIFAFPLLLLVAELKLSPGAPLTQTDAVQVVAGVLTLTALSVGLMGFAGPLIQYRESGILRAAALWPVSPAVLLGAMAAARLATLIPAGLLSLLTAAMLVPGTLGSGLWPMLGAFIAGGLVLLALGAAIGARLSQSQSGTALISMAYIALAATGEVFYRADLLPTGIRDGLAVLPVNAMMHALTAAATGPSGTLGPPVTVLVVDGGLLLAIAMASFRFAPPLRRSPPGSATPPSGRSGVRARAWATILTAVLTASVLGLDRAAAATEGGTDLSSIQAQVTEAEAAAFRERQPGPIDRLFARVEGAPVQNSTALTYWKAYWTAYLRMDQTLLRLQAGDRAAARAADDDGLRRLAALPRQDAETLVLTALLTQLRFTFSSPFDAPKLASDVNALLQQARSQSPDTVRRLYVEAQQDLKTPKMFGGGQRGEALLRQALALPPEPARPFRPTWGRVRCAVLLADTLNDGRRPAEARALLQEELKARPTDPMLLAAEARLGLVH